MLMRNQNNYRNYEKENTEQEPLVILKDLFVALTKADKKLIIISFIVFTILSFFASVEGDKCGLIVAFIPIDKVCIIAMLLIPLSFLAFTKWNLSPVLLSFYHVLLTLVIFCAHKYYVMTAFVQWYIVFLVNEMLCLISFSIKKYGYIAFLSIFEASLVMAMVLVIIRNVDRETTILYASSLIDLLASVLFVVVIAVSIRLWSWKKNSFRRQK